MAVVISQTANPAGVSAASTVATYSTVSIGTASADRIVVVTVGTELASSTPSACTIDYGSGDTAMTAGTLGSLGAVFAQTFRLAVPTGTTATIKVTFSATSPSNVQNHIAVYSVTGGTFAISGGDGSTDMDSSVPLTTGLTLIDVGGGFLAVAAGATDAVGKTWANATEDLDVDAGGFQFTTATYTTPGLVSRTCTGGTNGEDGALSYLIFRDSAAKTGVIQSIYAKNVANVDSSTLTFKYTPTTGNTIVVCVSGYQASGFDVAAANVTDNKSNTYNLAIKGDLDPVATKRAEILYAYNITSSASFIVTIDPVSTGNYYAWSISEVYGLTTTDPIDRTAKNTGIGTTVTNGTTATTSIADEIVFACYVSGDTLTSSGVGAVSPAFTEMYEQLNAASFIPGEGDYRVITSTGTQTNTWAIDVSSNYSAVIATFLTPTVGGTSVKDIIGMGFIPFAR